MSDLPHPLTDAQIRSYREQGWTLAPGMLPPAHLDLLRSSAQLAIDTTDAEMDRLGVDRLGISHRGKRYLGYGQMSAPGVGGQ